MFDRKLLLAGTALAGFGAMMLAAAPTAVLAQDTETVTVLPAAPEEAKPAQATDVEELVITGSRIRRNEFTSPSPVTVITRETTTLEGLADTAEILQTSSSASGSQQINNQLGAFVIEGGGGVNTISLRGLGAQRTLVLLNGRRAGPAGVGGQVGAFDLNVIPSSVIDRIEILKDGASSIYGSDAVAGVINIITRNEVDGGDVEVYYNRPFDSGGEVFRIAGTWGKTLENAHFSISADYWEQKELEQGDRSYTRCANDYYHDSTTGALTDITSRFTGKPFCYEASNYRTVYVPDLNAYAQYDPTQAEGPYSPFASLLADFGYVVGPNAYDWYLAAFGDSLASVIDDIYGPGSYNYSTYEYYHTDERIDAGNSVVLPNKRTTVFAEGSLDITPNFELYGELLLNRRETRQDAMRGIAPRIEAATYGSPFEVDVLPVVDNVPFNFSQTVDYTRFLAGARGDFGGGFKLLNGWDWDVFATQSTSNAEYGNDAVLDDAMWAAGDAASAYADGAGTNPDGCASAPVTPISGRTCVPIDWFDTDTMMNGLTQAQRDFLLYRSHSTTEYTQSIIEGTMSGDLFQLPAGPLSAAVGFHWRKDRIDDSPDANAPLQNLWGQTTSGRTTGSDTVRELFGEIEAPILRGAKFAEKLTLNASGRLSNYDSYGRNSTYKLGLNWQVIPSFRVRGTYGTSFRAPALYEMYLASLTGFLGQVSVDPCIHYEDAADPVLAANCLAEDIPEGYIGNGGSATITQGGGGKGFLEPETSLAKSIGVVWTPSFIDLNVAIDYFEIEVEDEVAQFGAANIVNLCYSLTDYPNSFCNLFVRNTDPSSSEYHMIETIENNYINIASQVNRGIDLTTRYKHEFPFADMTVDTQFTWQLEDTVDFSGLAQLDSNQIAGEPAFTGNATVRFDRGDWTLFWALDTIGHTFASDPQLGATSRYPTDVVFKRHRESTTYHAISLRKKFDDLTVLVGVQNLFDEQPPAQSFGEFRVGTAALNQYDMFGRRAFVHVTKSF